MAVDGHIQCRCFSVVGHHGLELGTGYESHEEFGGFGTWGGFEDCGRLRPGHVLLRGRGVGPTERRRGERVTRGCEGEDARVIVGGIFLRARVSLREGQVAAFGDDVARGCGAADPLDILVPVEFLEPFPSVAGDEDAEEVVDGVVVVGVGQDEFAFPLWIE